MAAGWLTALVASWSNFVMTDQIAQHSSTNRAPGGSNGASVSPRARPARASQKEQQQTTKTPPTLRGGRVASSRSTKVVIRNWKTGNAALNGAMSENSLVLYALVSSVAVIALRLAEASACGQNREVGIGTSPRAAVSASKPMAPWSRQMSDTMVAESRPAFVSRLRPTVRSGIGPTSAKARNPEQ